MVLATWMALVGPFPTLLAAKMVAGVEASLQYPRDPSTLRPHVAVLLGAMVRGSPCSRHSKGRFGSPGGRRERPREHLAITPDRPLIDISDPHSDRARITGAHDDRPVSPEGELFAFSNFALDRNPSVDRYPQPHTSEGLEIDPKQMRVYGRRRGLAHLRQRRDGWNGARRLLSHRRRARAPSAIEHPHQHERRDKDDACHDREQADRGSAGSGSVFTHRLRERALHGRALHCSPDGGLW